MRVKIVDKRLSICYNASNLVLCGTYFLEDNNMKPGLGRGLDSLLKVYDE